MSRLVKPEKNTIKNNNEDCAINETALLICFLKCKLNFLML